AASVSAIVVLPVPGAPASRWNLPCASQCGHSQRVASGEKAVAGSSSTCGALPNAAPGAGANSTKRTVPAGPAISCGMIDLLGSGEGNRRKGPTRARRAVQRWRTVGWAEDRAHAFEAAAGFAPIKDDGAEPVAGEP